METRPQSHTGLTCRPYILFPLTPLHAGSGRAIMEAVDLPVQKDAFGYPLLWSSSLKGALRSAFRRRKKEQVDFEKAIFGPDVEMTEDYASAITILEARLLALPARSLKRIYAYVTTPHLLKRARNMLEYLEILNPDISQKKQAIDRVLEKGEKMPITSSNGLFVEPGTLVLAEETITGVTSDEALASDIENLLKGVNLPIDIKDVSQRFVVVDDDRGKQLIRKSLPFLTRTALDYKKKTVKPGALWTEEYVPEMSLFYTTVLMGEPKLNEGREAAGSPNELMNELLKTLNSDTNGNFYLVLGGHETIGKGVVKFCAW